MESGCKPTLVHAVSSTSCTLTEQTHLRCMERRQAIPAEVLLPHARLQRPERVADHIGGPRQRAPLRCHAAPDRIEAVPAVVLLGLTQRRQVQETSPLRCSKSASINRQCLICH